MQALEQLKKDGYREVIVQSLHIIAGSEFEKIKKAAEKIAASFEKITVGRPLLYYMGQEKKPDDYQAAVLAIAREFPNLAAHEAILLHGHGGAHPANSAYGALQLKFIDAGFKNVYIYTIESYPKLKTVIEKLKNNGVRKITLMPLMLSAGSHATNDMADGPGSAKNLLISAGFQVEANLRGLGENSLIQDIYVAHAKDAASGISI
jgi:sirohydrochlorin cobaltochelatase